MSTDGKTIRIFLADGEPTDICLFVGPAPDDPSHASAYIGEGDSVLKRLIRRNRNESHGLREHSAVHPPALHLPGLTSLSSRRRTWS